MEVKLFSEMLVAWTGYIGVTPTYWRPPPGAVDNRVRAISFATGMQTSSGLETVSLMFQFGLDLTDEAGPIRHQRLAYIC